jgi:hypothetical protein
MVSLRRAEDDPEQEIKLLSRVRSDAFWASASGEAGAHRQVMVPSPSMSKGKGLSLDDCELRFILTSYFLEHFWMESRFACNCKRRKTMGRKAHFRQVLVHIAALTLLRYRPWEEERGDSRAVSFRCHHAPVMSREHLPRAGERATTWPLG